MVDVLYHAIDALKPLGVGSSISRNPAINAAIHLVMRLIPKSFSA
jgi:hypothetical protein